jgi:tRNA(Ile)-lysidine synthase
MVIEHVDRAIETLRIKKSRVLVAVSGGVDSSVLLHALVSLASKHGLDLAVGHVQHGLRGADSRLDEAAVLSAAAAYGLPANTEQADPLPAQAQKSSQARPTLQEAAREVRYAALQRMAEQWGADHIATAHNLDDQAETILMRVLRGTGPSGLQGIEHASTDGRIVRPLLAVSRAEILDFARTHAISWREDISNEGDAYTRNRLRHHWIPALRDEFNPQLLRAIARLADVMQEEEAWIRVTVADVADRMTAKGPVWGESALVWVEKGWNQLPDGLALRVIRHGLHELGRGRNVTRVHLQRVLDFLRRDDVETGRSIQLPGGDCVTRTATGYRVSLGPRDEFPAC